MSNLRFPVNLTGFDALALQRGSRRSLIRGAAGAGLALPAALASSHAVYAAQEHVHDDPGATPGAPVGYAPAAPADASHTPYNPHLDPVEPGPKHFEIIALDETVTVAKDVLYAGWTFNGTIPGPVFRAVEGDEVTITVKNQAAITHSVDTHAAKTPPEESYKNLAPGEEFTWTFTATYPGAFMYHCGTPPVLLHIGAGMFGAMIVDPKERWSPAQELIFVQNEYYFDHTDPNIMTSSMEKMMYADFMDYTTFNGRATQYADNPISIKVGEPVRIFFVNAGPNIWSSFHVVGAIFDNVYINANPKNHFVGLQSISIGPGDGAMVEFTVEQPGKYVAVNHAFGHAMHGAMAVLHAE
jgi:nitrite reductase (NO-forming)